ncbi:M20/M25/M40 family metallo-hydrolase [Oscillibacter sp. MSJ-2]|uniref:M20/M25/M40 family metallo-hydrolase n=1 Tax=Dysosmobacter acutus TaxID=2841504 RepID=A0ABS6FCP5_9FIRM|nr:M20/M25/M40 family metallo-hydrolase [Dysosmobacter acutus]MBU5628049.1 M20/M25/M40 family metallo-hydrolase [Dysosmobacter acutus]
MDFTPTVIDNYVESNRDEAIACLVEAVQIPSVTGDELAFSKVLKRRMEENGLTVETDAEVEGRPNLLADWQGTRPGKRFVFNGHMDVFPPDTVDPGPFGPWAGTISDGWLFGRGAADMKSGDCAALMAVAFLRRMGFDPKGSVLLSYMVDEENGGTHGVQYLLKKNKLQGDFGICMDCSAGKLLVTHGGGIRASCTYTSEPRHSSIRYPGKNALRKAAVAINELYKIDDRLGTVYPENFDQPCMSINLLHAGTAANVHPAQATFTIDRRLVPGEDRYAALKEITDTLDRLKEDDAEFDYQFEISSMSPYLDIPEDDPFIQLLQKSYEQIMGKPVEIFRRAGGSDASFIRESTGMPIPNFGVAEDRGEGGSGRPDERVNVQGYLDFIKVYMMAVVNALS